jgi:hypothetical protein
MSTIMNHIRHATGVERPERRAEMRRKTFKGAMLRFNGGYSVFDCIVRNRSGSGACLAFGNGSGVPARFELKIAGEDGVRTAIVRWRSANALGVFVR